MLVTEIKEISKTKVLICVDYDVVFALYKSECRKYSIKLNEEISCDNYCEIVNNILLKRAKIRSMNLLKARDYTEYQLIDKLHKNYYPQIVIDQTIEYLKSYGYIDDLRFAENFIKYAKTNKSKKQIELLLNKKGISKEKIKRAFQDFDELYGEFEEEKLIQKFLLKKSYDYQNSTVKEQQKIIAFLYRKGFSLDKIYKVLQQTD